MNITKRLEGITVCISDPNGIDLKTSRALKLDCIYATYSDFIKPIYL
jgi:hypothetical protein